MSGLTIDELADRMLRLQDQVTELAGIVVRLAGAIEALEVINARETPQQAETCKGESD